MVLFFTLIKQKIKILTKPHAIFYLLTFVHMKREARNENEIRAELSKL